MLHKYHVIYSIRYYPRFHVNAVGLGTYYPWIRGSASTSNIRFEYDITAVVINCLKPVVAACTVLLASVFKRSAFCSHSLWARQIIRTSGDYFPIQK